MVLRQIRTKLRRERVSSKSWEPVWQRSEGDFCGSGFDFPGILYHFP